MLEIQKEFYIFQLFLGINRWVNLYTQSVLFVGHRLWRLTRVSTVCFKLNLTQNNFIQLRLRRMYKHEVNM